MRVRLIQAAVALTALLLAGCGGDDAPTAAPIVVTPPVTSATAVTAAGAVTLPYAALGAVQLNASHGITSITVRAGGASSALLTAAPAAGDAAPKLSVASHIVTLTGSGAVTVWLNPALGWTVHIESAVSTATIDATQLPKFLGCAVDAAVGTLVVSLPIPTDTLPLLINAAVTDATFHLPTTGRAVLSVPAGTGSVDIDGAVTREAVENQVLPVPGGSAGAYEININSAVKAVVVDHAHA